MTADYPAIELAEHDRPEHTQAALHAISYELGQHDKTALSRLDVDAIQRQHDARRELHEFFQEYWEQAKADGLNPAVRTEWQAVAGMIDLMGELMGNAFEVGEQLDA